MVTEMAAHQVPHKQIATVIGIAPRTLYQHYREELDLGMATANAQVARTAFRMATSGKEPGITWKWGERFMGWGAPKDAGGSGPVNIYINTGIKRPGDDAVVIEGGNNAAQDREGIEDYREEKEAADR